MWLEIKLVQSPEITVTMILRELLGPSNSQRKIFCQVDSPFKYPLQAVPGVYNEIF